MNRNIIAKEVLKIAKELVASSNMDSFPLKSRLRKVTIDFDVDNPLYTEDMDWASEKISDTLVFSDKTKFVYNMTIYVFGFAGDQTKQGIFIAFDYDTRGWKHKETRYYGSVKKAFGTGSNSIFGYFDVDEAELKEAYKDLSDEDIKKIVSNGGELYKKVESSAMRLSKTIGR